jgi:hypothetical protein
MKPPSNIPMSQANGEVWPRNPPCRVVLSSTRTNWRDLVVEEHHIPSSELNDVMYLQHVVAVNVGTPMPCEFKKYGRFRRVYKTDTICLFPSHHPFCLRVKKDADGSADVLFVALDTVFVSQTAAALEVDPDRVELVEQQGATDSTLRHISMALRDGLKAGREQATPCMVRRCQPHWPSTCCANMAGSRWVCNTRVADCPEKN